MAASEAGIGGGVPTVASARLADIRARIPGFPSDLDGLDARPLKEVLSHGQLQALVLACRSVLPHISRDAFASNPTVADLIHWAEGGTDSPLQSDIKRGSYRTATVHLRPLNEQDVWALYYAALEPRNAHRWRFRGRTPSPEEFRALLFGPATMAQFMAVESATLATVGTVVAYAPDLSAGHCSIAIQRVAPSTGDSTSGLMIEGFLIFVQYVFDHFGCTKLYLELPEYNRSLVGGGAGSLLELEGRLRDHHRYADRMWDQWIYAIYKERWDEIAPYFRGPDPDSMGD